MQQYTYIQAHHVYNDNKSNLIKLKIKNILFDSITKALKTEQNTLIQDLFVELQKGQTYVLTNLQFFLTSPPSGFVIFPILTIESENCLKNNPGSAQYLFTRSAVCEPRTLDHISWSEFNKPSPLISWSQKALSNVAGDAQSIALMLSSLPSNGHVSFTLFKQDSDEGLYLEVCSKSPQMRSR